MTNGTCYTSELTVSGPVQVADTPETRRSVII
jgi:hypothetical protein